MNEWINSKSNSNSNMHIKQVNIASVFLHWTWNLIHQTTWYVKTNAYTHKIVNWDGDNCFFLFSSKKRGRKKIRSSSSALVPWITRMKASGVLCIAKWHAAANRNSSSSSSGGSNNNKSGSSYYWNISQQSDETDEWIRSLKLRLSNVSTGSLRYTRKARERERQEKRERKKERKKKRKKERRVTSLYRARVLRRKKEDKLMMIAV